MYLSTFRPSLIWKGVLGKSVRLSFALTVAVGSNVRNNAAVNKIAVNLFLKFFIVFLLLLNYLFYFLQK